MKSYSTLKGTLSYRSSEYEILALMANYSELEEFGFETNQNTSECAVQWLNPDGIISKILTAAEVEEFQKNIFLFIEVYNHQANGKVFELKEMSFKNKYHETN